jgi:hypothetical protein
VVEEARRRRWGRRDPAPIQQADAARRTAERDLDRVAELVTKVRQNVAEERRASQTRARAMNRSAAQRARLVAAIADLDTALASVGADRISVASLDRHPNRDIQPVAVREPVTSFASAEVLRPMKPEGFELGLEL